MAIRNPREPRPGKPARKVSFSSLGKREIKRTWSPWDEPVDGVATSPHGGIAGDEDEDRGAGRRTF